MSNITSSKAYIQTEGAVSRSPVSESLIQTMGGAINWLNDSVVGKQLTSQEFLSTAYWTCPANITKVLVLGCGGGGSGAAAYNGANYTDYDEFFVSGGAGAVLGIQPVTVVPGLVYQVVIGAGGSSVTITTNNISDGSSGADSIFKDNVGTPLVTFYGGGGGLLYRRLKYVDGLVTKYTLDSNVSPRAGTLHGQAFSYAGANGEISSSGLIKKIGFGGGAGAYGNGGTGVVNTTSAGSGGANTGAGGGGIYKDAGGGSAVSGAGGSGRLTLIYVT